MLAYGAAFDWRVLPDARVDPGLSFVEWVLRSNECASKEGRQEKPRWTSDG